MGGVPRRIKIDLIITEERNMQKKILTKDEMQNPLKQGMDKLANIVKATLGPGGRTIMIQRQGQALDGTPLSPKLTKDGVSVAEQCADKDESIDVVIQTVKNICKKTNSDAGDGTTTAIVLGQAILEETERVLQNDKSLNPQLVRESLEAASAEIIKDLKAEAKKVEDVKTISEVATISANGDTDIGKIIGDAFDRVGAEGVITVDEGMTSGVTLDVVDGYQFNRGAQAREAFFNNKALTQFEAESEQGVAVVVYDGKLNNYTHVIPMILKLADADPKTGQGKKQPPPIVIVANEFSRDVIQFLLINKQEKGLQICCVEGPHMSHVRTGYYDDLAAYTGGRRLGNGNPSLDAIELTDIGFVKKAVIDKYKTTFYDGLGGEDRLLDRVDQLKAMKEVAESPYDAQVLNDRVAALTSGVAKIGVGGATELEIKEKYDRIEDALNAARAAIQEGIIPGGGSTLTRIAERLQQKEDKNVGELILSKALRAPLNQILSNIGQKLSTSNYKKLIEDPNVTYDARNKKLVDAFKAGIIDPVKVTRSALENAVSIAGLLSTSGGAIIFTKDK